MSYQLSYENKTFLLKFNGELTMDELNEGNGAVHGHPMFDDHEIQIIDFLDADLSNVPLEETSIPAQIDAVASHTTSNHIKIVFIATEKHAADLVMSYISHAQKLIPRWEFKLVPTMKDAMAWAGTE